MEYINVPSDIKSANLLIILIAYNTQLQKFVLCVYSFTKEDKDISIQFYSLQKVKCNFNLKRLT